MQSYQHFTLTERESLRQMLGEGKSLRSIATTLGRNVSSVSREIKRNQNKDSNYNAWRATCLYLQRRKKCKRKPRLQDEEAYSFVRAGLNKYWSPEIISKRWRMEHPDRPLGHTTIYRALARGQIATCTPKTHLRRRGKQKHNHNTQVIYPVHTIHDRPAEVETRERLGDMEGDTISGAIGKGCVLTVVDRKSRMLYAALCASRNSSTIVAAFEKAISGVAVESLTLDRGSEFARFSELEQNHHTTVYFADPHSPWQRGTNENTNDLIRFFFPKGTDFTAVSEEALKHVISIINNRPRKCLGWLSPIEFVSSKCCA
jgi:IS30 family transposase